MYVSLHSCILGAQFDWCTEVQGWISQIIEVVGIFGLCHSGGKYQILMQYARSAQTFPQQSACFASDLWRSGFLQIAN